MRRAQNRQLSSRDVHLADFLKTNLTKFAVILSEKASKGRFFVRDQLQNHTNEGKEKDRRKRKSEEEGRRRREKSNGCALSFYNGYFGLFGRKKAVGPKKSI